MKMVLVEWEDAALLDSGTWVNRADAEPSKAVIFHSLGWLYELSPEAVTLTDTANPDFMSPRNRIPVGMVRKLLEFDPSSGKALAIPKPKRKRTPR